MVFIFGRIQRKDCPALKPSLIRGIQTKTWRHWINSFKSLNKELQDYKWFPGIPNYFDNPSEKFYVRKQKTLPLLPLLNPCSRHDEKVTF